LAYRVGFIFGSCTAFPDKSGKTIRSQGQKVAWQNELAAWKRAHYANGARISAKYLGPGDRDWDWDAAPGKLADNTP